MSFTHRCRPCSGDGYYNRPEDTCQVCHGRGQLIVNGDRDDYQRCATCSGDGYTNRRPDTCPVCHGLGIVPKVYATWT
jgi:DnaJ-class molecular chaperone